MSVRLQIFCSRINTAFLWILKGAKGDFCIGMADLSQQNTKYGSRPRIPIRA